MKDSDIRFLVFQHIDCEHPGTFRDYFAADGIFWQPVELDDGEPIPDLSGFDALWVMGGPMDAWEEDDHPWLIREKAAIREAVLDRDMAFMGICLGHQLLADALGGEVGPARTPEIGILDVHLTDAGRESPFLSGFSDSVPCLQWHSAEVLAAPEGAEVLVSSPDCAVQAMSYGDRAFSMQYHVEIGPETVPAWGEIPAYKTALEKAAGPDALARFESDANAQMDRFQDDSRRIYQNFMSACGFKR